MKESRVIKSLSLVLTTCCIVSVVCGGIIFTEIGQSHPALIETLSDFTSLQYWDLARNDERLQKEFYSWDLRILDDPSQGIGWHFTPKSVSFNDLYLRVPIGRKFRNLTVEIENVKAPLRFSIKMQDADGSQWLVDPVSISGDRTLRELVFHVDNFYIAPWSNDRDGLLNFPVRSIAFIASGLTVGEEYELKFRRVEAEFYHSPRTQVLDMEFPGQLKAGNKFYFLLKLKLLSGRCYDNKATLELRKDDRRVSSYPLKVDSPLTEWEIGQERTLQLEEIELGTFHPGGIFNIAILCAGYEFELGSDDEEVKIPGFEIESRSQRRTIAVVKPYRGVRTLFINGEPQSGMAYAAYRTIPEVFEDFSQAGVKLFSISATPSASGYGKAKTSWLAPEKFDFSELDDRVMIILDKDADAYIFLRIALYAPRWWCEKYPDELVTYDPGNGNTVPFLLKGKIPVASWASELWREDTARALRKFIEHVETSAYADRIIGYHLVSGTTEEWIQWGSNEDHWTDYSPANLTAFREWLREKYGNDEAIHAAWHNKTKSLETARIPTKRERMESRLGALRDPSTEQPSIDYYMYNSEMVAETINYFASVVKDATQREKIVGIFYGYVLQLAGEQRLQNSGHLALRSVWDSPDIDFISSPTGYAFRQIGTGTSYSMSLFDGVMQAGKLWFNENDIRTSLAPVKVGQLGKPANVTGDKLLQRRELAASLARGNAQWWFDVGGNRYDDPELMNEIEELCIFADKVLPVDRTPVDEVAFIVDTRSFYYMKVGDPFCLSLIKKQIPQAARLGAPVGWYELSDLVTLEPRRMYVFLNVFASTGKDISHIQSLMSDNRLLVFVYAPGVYMSNSFEPDASERILGFPLKYVDQNTQLTVRVENNNPLMQGLGGIEFGLSGLLHGYFIPAKREGEIIGRLKNGEPGLLLRDVNGCKIVYSAAPTLPAHLLRRLAELAGVHFYLNTDDVVWASRGMVAVSVNESGRRKISLPEPARVFDVYENELISEHTDSFYADFSSGETKLWSLDGE